MQRYTGLIKEASPSLYTLLKGKTGMANFRKNIHMYLVEREVEVSHPTNDVTTTERIVARDAINVLRSMILDGNEESIGFSALALLRDVVKERYDDLPKDLAPGFFEEFVHLFRAIEVKTKAFQDRRMPTHLYMKGREAAIQRSKELDAIHRRVESWLRKYRSGLDPSVIMRRKENRYRIIRRLGGKERDWYNWKWHLSHIAKTAKSLERLVKISDEDRDAINKARRHSIPFGVTPYYAHLMDNDLSQRFDHAVRAQVIPPMHYVQTMAEHKSDRRESFDFMGEQDTSPIDLVTRRYPLICIIKPYNTCPQICVYCQRNWEIDQVMAEGAMAPCGRIDAAIEWIAETSSIKEVLVTGGDPLVMSDEMLHKVLGKIAEIDHVERIRIGTRLPVTIPFRITERLLDILGDIHDPPRRELCMVTHVEHVYEVTPKFSDVIKSLKQEGINVYNQLVYTVMVSRRFETCALRRLLRRVGVDPYYTFCTKGKEETKDYRVPMARLLQEFKEEARLFPGLVRTDIPVYNVPRLGKNIIISKQHHELVSVLPDGRRVYKYHPWEKKIQNVNAYVGTDTSIHEYLQNLKAMGEDVKDYRSIWYYY